MGQLADIKIMRQKFGTLGRNLGHWADINVMRVGSDTFGDHIFQKGLQN